MVINDKAQLKEEENMHRMATLNTNAKRGSNKNREVKVYEGWGGGASQERYTHQMLKHQYLGN